MLSQTLSTGSSRWWCHLQRCLERRDCCVELFSHAPDSVACGEQLLDPAAGTVTPQLTDAVPTVRRGRFVCTSVCFSISPATVRVRNCCLFCLVPNLKLQCLVKAPRYENLRVSKCIAPNILILGNKRKQFRSKFLHHPFTPSSIPLFCIAPCSQTRPNYVPYPFKCTRTK